MPIQASKASKIFKFMPSLVFFDVLIQDVVGGAKNTLVIYIFCRFTGKVHCYSTMSCFGYLHYGQIVAYKGSMQQTS